ncbi:MAG: M42 family metallopeptidase [Bacillota bacterium]
MPTIDMSYLTDILVKLCTTPSVTGNTRQAVALCETEFRQMGLATRYTNKGALIATLEGRSSDGAVTFSGHVDTLGAMVKELKSNGRLALTPIGGYMMNAVEGERCWVETSGGRQVSGTILTTKASTHVYSAEATKLERKPENMEIRLDEKVSNIDDLRQLGIEVGDFIAFDPRTVVTSAGFIKSRHLDDKAGVACILAAARALSGSGQCPPRTVHFFISNYEEIGHGASAGIPQETVDFIAVDMGAIGSGQTSDEYTVSICAKDSSGPYTLEIRNKLVELCRKNNIPYRLDIYPYYGSDASAAVRAGADIRTGLIGPGVDASHAHERTHQEALEATARLIVAYALV